MPDIKCTVKNCAFWGEGEICKASAVEVDNNINPGASSSLHNMGLGLVSGLQKSLRPQRKQWTRLTKLRSHIVRNLL
jgi:hypothetical protein